MVDNYGRSYWDGRIRPSRGPGSSVRSVLARTAPSRRLQKPEPFNVSDAGSSQRSTMKLRLLLRSCLPIVTVTGPVPAKVGTVAMMQVSETIVKLADKPPKLTAV